MWAAWGPYPKPFHKGRCLSPFSRRLGQVSASKAGAGVCWRCTLETCVFTSLCWGRSPAWCLNQQRAEMLVGTSLASGTDPSSVWSGCASSMEQRALLEKCLLEPALAWPARRCQAPQVCRKSDASLSSFSIKILQDQWVLGALRTRGLTGHFHLGFPLLRPAWARIESQIIVTFFKKTRWKNKNKPFRGWGQLKCSRIIVLLPILAVVFSAPLFFSLKEIIGAQAEKGPPGLPNLVSCSVGDITGDN